MWTGLYSWGDLDAAFAEADRVIKIPELHFHRFNSTPLECDGALVEYNRGVGQWTIHTNNQFPGFAAIMMGPAMKVGLDKLRFVTQDIGGGFGNKITSHPQLVVCCLLARKLNRPVQWTEWRTDFHLSMSHGNERWFRDTEVAVKDDGTLLGFRTKALDDAGAWLRYEPLGGVIWAQVTPGMYRWRHIELEFTQVATNKAPVSPNRGYSRMQHLWFTERVIDIVARELGLDPVEVRKRNYIRAEDMPYETPNGCVYDSGDYAGDARPRARADRLGLDPGQEGGGEGAREAARRRDRLDPRLRHEQLRPVAAHQPGAAVLGQQRGRDGQARHLRRDRRHARHDAAGAGARDDRGAGRGRHPQLLGRRRARPRRPRQLLELARRLLRHVREPVRGHRAQRGQGRDRHARGRDQEARRRRLRRRAAGGARARRRWRPDQGEPGRVPPVHGLRRDHQREQRRPAGGPRRDAQLPLRLPAAVRGARRREEVRQPHAHVRRRRSTSPSSRSTPRPARTRSSTTPPSTTAASGSTRRSSRGR